MIKLRLSMKPPPKPTIRVDRDLGVTVINLADFMRSDRGQAQLRKIRQLREARSR